MSTTPEEHPGSNNTPSKALLYLDVLGARQRWHRDGVAGAECASKTLRVLTASVLKPLDKRPLDGGIDTDSVCLIFAEPEDAIRAGRDFFRAAFRTGDANALSRLWLRGVILQHWPEEPFRRPRSLSTPLSMVQYHQYSRSLLEAISVETSGFKGMRLLVENSLITAHTCQAFQVPVGDGCLIPFLQLQDSFYPARVEGKYRDFLWMADRDEEAWLNRKTMMGDRLGWSAQVKEEQLQAAASQDVFDECNAVILSLKHRKK